MPFYGELTGEVRAAPLLALASLIANVAVGEVQTRSPYTEGVYKTRRQHVYRSRFCARAPSRLPVKKLRVSISDVAVVFAQRSAVAERNKNLQAGTEENNARDAEMSPEHVPDSSD